MGGSVAAWGDFVVMTRQETLVIARIVDDTFEVISEIGLTEPVVDLAMSEDVIAMTDETSLWLYDIRGPYRASVSGIRAAACVLSAGLAAR